jgi:hypothetical protein
MHCINALSIIHLHDVHLKFTGTGLCSILFSSNSNSSSDITIHPYGQDIRIERRVMNTLEIQIAVHRTDTVTIMIGLSSE